MKINKSINIDDIFSCYKKYLIGIIEIYNGHSEETMDDIYFVREIKNYYIIKEYNKFLILEENKETISNYKKTDINYSIDLKYINEEIEAYIKSLLNNQDKIFLFKPKEKIELKNIKNTSKDNYEMLPLHIDLTDEFLYNNNTCILNPNIMVLCDLDTLISNIKNKDNIEK